MNNQQLELLLRNADAHPDIKRAIFDINEELQDTRRALQECAKVMDGMMNLINKNLAVSTAVKDLVDKNFRTEDGLEAATRVIGHDEE